MLFEDKTIKVRITFVEPILGTLPANEEIYREFVASKAPDAETIEDEVASLGAEAVVEKGKTVFPKLEDGTPYLYDYQIKGFLKDTVGGLRKIPDTESSKIKAYKKEIDKLIFVEPRRIPLQGVTKIKECQRPLRAQTAQGERISLALSEEIPEGAYIELEIVLLDARHEDLIRECLDYGRYSGIGQWRNSGKGRFVWEEID